MLKHLRASFDSTTRTNTYQPEYEISRPLRLGQLSMMVIESIPKLDVDVEAS